MPVTADELGPQIGFDIWNSAIPALTGGKFGAGSDVGQLAPWMGPGMGGAANDAGGQTSMGAGVSEEAMKALRDAGYKFDWKPDGYGNSGTLIAYDKDGNEAGQFAQQDQSSLKSLGQWGLMMGAAFGGLGLAGAGPLAGMFGGAGGGAAGSIGAGEGASQLAAYSAANPVTAGQLAGTVNGLNLGAGAAAGGSALGGIGGGSAALGGIGGGGSALGAATPFGSFSLPTAAAGSAPSWLSTAMNVGGPLVSAASGLIGTSKGIGAMRDATNQANDLQRHMYDTTRSDNMPALESRNSALASIKALLSDPSMITKDPSYGFQLDEGEKLMNNSAAAKGMTYSGQQQKALTQYGQNFAGTKLNESFGRLSTLAGLGQAGASTIANAGSSYAGTVGNNLMGMGDASAARSAINANLIGNALSGATAYGNKNGWWNSGG